MEDKINFNFIWEGKGFDTISSNVIELANKLLEFNLIKVDTDLNEDGFVRILHTGVCSKRGLVESLSDNLVKEDTYANVFRVSPKGNLNSICKARSDNKRLIDCQLSACPIMVAGYLYYLRNKNDNEIDNRNKEEEIDMYSRNLQELERLDVSDEIKEYLTPLAMDSVKGFRMVLLGEEGTDKNRIIANIKKFLYAAGKLSDNKYYSLNISSLSDGKDRYHLEDGVLYDINNLKPYLDAMENNTEGSDAAAGRKINKSGINNLVNTLKGKYVVIDCDELEFKRFLKTNPKLSYLFDQVIVVDDYSNDKIIEIFKSLLPEEIKNQFDDNCKIEYENYLEENRKYLPFKNNDLSTYLATYALSKGKIILPPCKRNDKSLEDMFKNIIGMDNVKKQMKELYEFLLLRNKYEKEGNKFPDFNLHMMFLGNPGTGKTTIARLLAQTLFDLGYIKENKLMEVDVKDLVAPYTGQTYGKTARVIDSALGGVLFIDEAYSLAQNKSGEEALAILLKAMEDYKGDLVVIFAGYSKEMQEFVRINSGLKSRIGYTFEFADYNENELIDIFKLKAEKLNLSITSDGESALRELMNYGKSRKNFGNGRFVDNVLQKTLTKHAKVWINGGTYGIIDKDSIPSVEDLLAQSSGERNPDAIESLFEDIVGMDSIKKQVIELGKYIKFRDKMNELSDTNLPDMRLHMLFTGDAGTGKTTMARKITEMLYNIGCIRINKLVEVERKDLVAEFIGQTAPKTEKVIESALGGVLFVDEAYSLCPIDNARDFGQEAIATLIKAMEDYRDELVVIFAGYPKEMKRFVESNSGIASRIGYTFEFENYKDEDLYKIFEIKCKKYNLVITKKVKNKVMEVFKYFSSVENFGNGRFVDKLLQEILISHACSYKENEVNIISEDDIPSIKKMITVTYNSRDNLVIPADVDLETRKRIAIHELGHAIAHYINNHGTNIKLITIIPEGMGALGYVLNEKEAERILSTRNDYINDIESLLAGRAAEELFFGKDKISSGCTNDLEKANNIVNEMFYYYGMSNSLGLISTTYKSGSVERNISLDEVKNTLDECYTNILSKLTEHREIFDRVFNYLMEKGTITGEEFLDVVENKTKKKETVKKTVKKKTTAKKTTSTAKKTTSTTKKTTKKVNVKKEKAL